jgi:hypothetical protein
VQRIRELPNGDLLDQRPESSKMKMIQFKATGPDGIDKPGQCSDSISGGRAISGHPMKSFNKFPLIHQCQWLVVCMTSTYKRRCVKMRRMVMLLIRVFEDEKDGPRTSADIFMTRCFCNTSIDTQYNTSGFQGSERIDHVLFRIQEKYLKHLKPRDKSQFNKSQFRAPISKLWITTNCFIHESFIESLGFVCPNNRFHFIEDIVKRW